MTMSLNACVKRKHPRTSGHASKCPLKSEWSVVLLCPPSKRADDMCGEDSFPPVRFATCPSQGTVDACHSVCHNPREKVSTLEGYPQFSILLYQFVTYFLVKSC
ncbi:hypothetical protein AVEN_24081-1 [Araneus ventricosus]|uniref:Uncharacterized protein n=1 Tax=Araneus ventricosus TaxID=182803 RepID=A0A4Y2BXY0_ARAVE|nr:hypothetical protein AVEN_24081-1 [Araneus ventricosus]